MTLKRLFYNDSTILYLNSGTQSKPPIPLIEQADNYRMLGYKNPVELHLLFPEKLYQAQIQFSEFIQCEPEDLFFTNNVTESLNHFILGIQLPEGAEVFIPDFEYGATINICRSKCEQEKRKLHLLPLSKVYQDSSLSMEQVNQELLDYFKRLDIPNSSLVVLSHGAHW